MRRSAPKLWLGILAAFVTGGLLVAGCGGSGSSSTTSPGGTNGGDAPKKATAPNAPAGSKVVACHEGRMETEELRASAVDCGTARTTMRAWERSHACTLGKGASRGSCALGDFRCQAVRSGRGASVSCARAGGDVTFIATAWLLRKSGGPTGSR